MINGVVAVPVMAIMMWLAAAPKVMGDFAITGWTKALGWVATAVMAVAVAAMLATSWKGVSLCRSSWNQGEKKRFVRTLRRRTP